MRAITIPDNGTIIITKTDTACAIQWNFRQAIWQIVGDKELVKEVTTFFSKNIMSKDFEHATYNELYLICRLYASENTGIIEEFGNYIASIGD